MSDEGLSLSDELLGNLLGAIQQHDPRASQNMHIVLQYLAAVQGYFAADYPGPASERNELLDQLLDFAKDVADDRAAQLGQQQPETQQPEVPAGRSVETKDPAVGIWKPE